MIVVLTRVMVLVRDGQRRVGEESRELLGGDLQYMVKTVNRIS